VNFWFSGDFSIGKKKFGEIDPRSKAKIEFYVAILCLKLRQHKKGQ